MDDLGYGSCCAFLYFSVGGRCLGRSPRSHPAAQKVEDAYVYIKYVDIHGRDIYATQTIKGISGDYANGNDYIRNITTYRFVRTEPGRIQFDAKRRGTIKIVYEKEQKGAR